MKFRCTVTFKGGQTMVAPSIDLKSLEEFLQSCAENNFKVEKVELEPIS